MPPTQLGPYTIGRSLGKGGMGVVFAAVDTTTGEPAAVKVLATALGMQEGFRERFAAEIESLRLLRHPNIVRLLGFGEQDDCYYYAMELVEGRSLEDELQGGRVFTPAEVVEIGLQTCHALKHAHDSGVIHRDLKPANLLLTVDGEVKLSDFGIARLFGNAGITREGGVIGTAEYMAPEQADGRPATERSDLYSLGGVMYSLLARRPPFLAKTVPEMLQLQRFATPEPVQRYAPDTPTALDEVVQQLLAKEPDQRLPTALVLSRRLESLAQSIGQSDVIPASPPGLVAPPQASSTADVPDPNRVSHEPAVGASEKRFVAVGEEASDASRWQLAVNTASAWLSPQTLGPVIALVLVGVAVWYVMQPASADRLYARVKQLADNGKLQSSTAAEMDIEAFLKNYADDPRAEEMRGYQDLVGLAKDERRFDYRARGLSFRASKLSPVQQAYVEAVALLDRDPDLCRRKMQAIVDLYSDDDTAKLAQQQLDRLNKQEEQLAAAAVADLEKQVGRAEELQKTDKAAADRIWAAIVELYAAKPWAKAAVERARRELDRSDVAERR